MEKLTLWISQQSTADFYAVEFFHPDAQMCHAPRLESMMNHQGETVIGIPTRKMAGRSVLIGKCAGQMHGSQVTK